MRGFLWDENLPGRVDGPWVRAISLPVVHATELGAAVSDSQLWAVAAERELAIVSKDADFTDRMMLSDPPPWVVHVRFRNRRLREFYGLMERLWPVVEAKLPDHKLVCVCGSR